MRIIAATQNKHKIKEINAVLEAFGMQLTSLADVGLADLEIEETGTTCEENSLIKAETVCRLTGEPAVADDTGLMIDALDGAPGVYSARFAGENCSEADNRVKTLRLLEGLPFEQRSAKFICVLTMVWPDGKKLQATGECSGRMLSLERGEHGFGYDSIFAPDMIPVKGALPQDVLRDNSLLQPNSEWKSFAELSDDDKNAISHRGRALIKLEEMLSSK
ncbi:MAG: RdgB/HAM1 family non-canonical purine NTP pyrophosphatase [Firmicutes bacterium]|nr:RdgB/HAM1 family non-canonical purine NTP pyrophosphatase [Bacillota bacterium]